jgi:transcriptional regulator with XRE-family HTH domain
MINDKEKFCNDLKEFFRSQGLAQRDIAERLGVSQQYVAALLNGTNSFGKKAAQKWAAEFGLSEAWLLTGVGDITAAKVNQEENLHCENHCIAEYLSLLRKKDEQIDKLLEIIKNMQK